MVNNIFSLWRLVFVCVYLWGLGGYALAADGYLCEYNYGDKSNNIQPIYSSNSEVCAARSSLIGMTLSVKIINTDPIPLDCISPYNAHRANCINENYYNQTIITHF